MLAPVHRHDVLLLSILLFILMHKYKYEKLQTYPEKGIYYR